MIFLGEMFQKVFFNWYKFRVYKKEVFFILLANLNSHILFFFSAFLTCVNRLMVILTSLWLLCEEEYCFFFCTIGGLWNLFFTSYKSCLPLRKDEFDFHTEYFKLVATLIYFCKTNLWWKRFGQGQIIEYVSQNLYSLSFLPK